MVPNEFNPESDDGPDDGCGNDPRGVRTDGGRPVSDPVTPFSIRIVVNGVKITIETDGKCPPSVEVGKGQ